MKKIFFFLMGMMLSCGFVRAAEGDEPANGVRISGNVSIKAGNLSYVTPNDNYTRPDTVYLEKDGKALKSLIERKGSDYQYSFENVSAGEYDLTYLTSVKDGVIVSFNQRVTVADEDVVIDIEAVDDPTRVGVDIMPKYAVGWSSSNLGGVRIVCQKGNEEQIKYSTSTVNAYGTEVVSSAFFVLDTMGEYMVHMSKEGYKDSLFSLKALKEYSETDGVSYGKKLNVVMKEDLGDLVTLKGTIAAAGLTMPETKLNTLYLVLSSKGKIFNSEIRNGAYEFKEVPVGKVSYYLTTTDDKNLSFRSKNWQFTENNRDSLEFDLTGNNGDIVSNNLNVKRVGVDVSGVVANGEGGYPPYLSDVKVKLSNDTYRDSAFTYGYSGFLISRVGNGNYKLEYTKVGYITVSKDITIDMSKMPVDSVATVEEVSLYPSVEADYVFSGQIQYPTAESQMIKVENATVEMYNMDGVMLADTVTDMAGIFRFKVHCLIGTKFRFRVFHESIDTATTTAIVEEEENTVEFSIFAKMPELFGMFNAKAAQIGVEPKVKLTWEWPQALKDAYVNENGEGIYQISQVLVFRQEKNETAYTQIGLIVSDILNTTAFVDSAADSKEASSLQFGKTYNYYLQVRYSKPFAFGKPDNVVVRDAENLTVTLSDDLSDRVNLVLNVNDISYGEVSGAGAYAKGSEVNINATAKTGYAFVAWVSGLDTVARTAAYKLVLNQDSTLTAVFAKATVANDEQELAQWNVSVENGCLLLYSNTACRYEVYSGAGMLVKQGALNGACRVDIGKSGLYIVRRISSTGISAKKVILR